MNDMRKYINLVESIESGDDIIPGERTEYNTLAKQLAAVRLDGWAIKHIKKPSEEVQLAAVREKGWAIVYTLHNGIAPSIPVQRAAVLNHPIGALEEMIKYNLPISKMIQWTAAKRIKERNLVDNLHKDVLNKLDPDVQNFLRSDTP